MSHYQYYVFCIILLTTMSCQAEYSQKELAVLIEIERRALDSQEALLQQAQDNENVHRAIQQTITRIKSRIILLEKQKKAL